MPIDAQARGLAAYANSAAGISAAGGATADIQYVNATSAIPAEFGLDQTRYPFRFYIQASSSQAQKRGLITGLNWQDYMADCLAGPVKWCDVSTGSDSTGTGTQANPFQTIGKAYDALGGVPGVVKVVGSEGGKEYPYTSGFTKQGAYSITTNVVFMAVSGRVVVGTFANNLTWTADSTYPQCFTTTRASARRLFDMSRRDPLTGYYFEPTLVSSAVICSQQPGSYFISGSTVLYNPIGGITPTNANTRVHVGSIENFYVGGTTQCNVFLCGETDNDGFDLEGSRSAPFCVQYSAFSSGTYTFVGAKNCSFRYGGYPGSTDSTQRAVITDTLNGLAYFENCDMGAADSDGLNGHNTNGSADHLIITLNCTFSDNGRKGGTNQGFTIHEEVKAIDVCGLMRFNHGGNIRNIGSSKMVALGTSTLEDRGDRQFSSSNTIRPTEVRIDDTAKFWGYRMSVSPTGGSDFAFRTTVNGEIYLRDTVALRGVSAGNINTY